MSHISNNGATTGGAATSGVGEAGSETGKLSRNAKKKAKLKAK